MTSDDHIIPIEPTSPANPRSAADEIEDDLRRTVDYGAVVGAACAIVAEGHTLLVETLAEKIALAALADPRVVRARVSVEKPDAFAEAASVGVSVERFRV